MELSSILTFFGVFITILCLLFGIAYYGINSDRTYEDALKEKGITIEDLEKEKRKRKEQSKKQQQTGQNKTGQVSTVNKLKVKRQTDETDTNNETEEEAFVSSKVRRNVVTSAPVQVEQPTVVKPKQQAQQTQQQQQQQPQVNGLQNGRTLSDSSNGLVKEKPKAAIKPNQTKPEVVVAVNGFDHDDDDGEFTVQGSRKDLKQRQQQRKDASSDVDAKRQRSIESVGKSKQVAIKQLAAPQQPQVVTVANVSAPQIATRLTNAQQNSDFSKVSVQVTATAPVQSQEPAENVVTEKQVLLQQVKRLNEQNSELVLQVKDKDSSLSKLKDSHEKLLKQNAELETLKHTNTVLQGEMTKLTQRCNALEKERTTVDSKHRVEVDRLLNEKQKLTNQLSLKEKEVQNVNQNTELLQQNQDLQKRLDLLTNEINETNKTKQEITDNFQNEKNKLLSELNSKENCLNEANVANKSYELKIAQFDENLLQLKQQLTEKDVKIQELVNEVDKLNNQKQTVPEVQSNDNQVVSLEQHNEALTNKDNEIKAYQADLQQKTNSLDNLNNEINSLNEKLNAIDNENKRLSSSLTETENKLNENVNKLNEYVQLLALKDENLRNLEENLNNSKNSVQDLEASNKSLNSLVEELRAKHEDELNQRDTEFKKTEQVLLQSVNNDELDALKNELETQRNRNNELEANLKSSNESLENLKVQLENDLNKKDAERRELEDRLNEVNKSLSDLNEELKKQHENVVNNFENEKRELEERLNESNKQELNRLNEELEIQRQSYDELEINYSILNVTFEEAKLQFENDLLSKENDRRENEERLNNLHNLEVTRLNERLKNHTRAYNELHAMSVKNYNELQNKEKEKHELQEQLLNTNKEELNRLNEDLQNQRNAFNELQSQLASLNNDNNELKRKLEEEISNKEIVKRETQEQINNLNREEIERLNQELESQKRLNEELQSNLNTLNETLRNYETNTNNSNSLNQEQVNKLNEELERQKQSNEELTATNTSLNNSIEQLKSQLESQQNSQNDTNNEHVERLRQELDEQKNKNNNLIERSWKIIEALRITEQKLNNQHNNNNNNTNNNEKNDVDKLKSSLEQLQDENNHLKANNLQLRSILETTEKSIVSLETAVRNREANLLSEIEKAKNTSKKFEKEKFSLETKLNDEIADLKEKLRLENESKQELLLKVEHTSNGTDLSEKIKSLEEENNNLKSLLDDEKKSNKKSASERLKLQSIIRFGQDALAEEQKLISKLEQELDKQPQLRSNSANGVDEASLVNQHKQENNV